MTGIKKAAAFVASLPWKCCRWRAGVAASGSGPATGDCILVFCCDTSFSFPLKINFPDFPFERCGD